MLPLSFGLMAVLALQRWWECSAGVDRALFKSIPTQLH